MTLAYRVLARVRWVAVDPTNPKRAFETTVAGRVRMRAHRERLRFVEPDLAGRNLEESAGGAVVSIDGGTKPVFPKVARSILQSTFDR